MDRTKLMGVICLLSVGAVVGGGLAVGRSAEESRPAGREPIELPPGWTEADMQACVEAGTTGKEHESLARDVGVWRGTSTMWMAPGMEPVKSECTSTITSMMDGRYFKYEFAGEVPGMGPYSGFGIQGYDNVAERFVSIWIDNHSTGIMNGVGERSPDGKTLTWTYTYHCPIQKKPVTMREVEASSGPDTKTLTMFGPEPKSGKEYKMMRIELTRRPEGK